MQCLFFIWRPGHHKSSKELQGLGKGVMGDSKFKNSNVHGLHSNIFMSNIRHWRQSLPLAGQRIQSIQQMLIFVPYYYVEPFFYRSKLKNSLFIVLPFQLRDTQPHIQIEKSIPSGRLGINFRFSFSSEMLDESLSLAGTIQ